MRNDYPSVQEPSLSPESMQTAIKSLIQGYQMLTGQTGNNEYSLVEGLVQIQKRVGSASGRILELNELVVSANEVLAQRTSIIEAEILNARGGTANLLARITQVDTARISGDNALASRATTIEAELTSARGGQSTLAARITQVDTARIDGDTAQATSTSALSASFTGYTTYNDARVTSVDTARISGDNALASSITTVATTVGANSASISSLLSSVNGLSVQWAVQGYINGVTGGLVLTGIAAAGGGAVYNLEIYANVTIHGSLLVTGSVNTGQMAGNAVSKVAAAVWRGSSGYVQTLIATRDSDLIIMYSVSDTTASTRAAAVGEGTYVRAFPLDINGGVYDYLFTNDAVADMNGTKVIMPASKVFQIHVTAGTYLISVLNPHPYDLTLSLVVLELAR